MLIFCVKKEPVLIKWISIMIIQTKNVFFLLWKSIKFDRINLKKKVYNILLFEL